jgi:hypothetical protein
MKGNKFLLTLAVMVTTCCFMQAQTAPAAQSNRQDTQGGTESAKPLADKLLGSKAAAGEVSTPLVRGGVGPASTESVAAGAARDLAKQKGAGTKSQVEGRGKSRTLDGSRATGDAVVEFHVAPRGTGLDEVSASVSSKGGGQALSRVHGELYGVAGGGGRAAAESVGVTSKDRKTSVYVRSDQTRSEPPQSH